MSVTLNQQAMEHAMASRPAITDPVAPSARAGFQFARFAAMAWRSAAAREGALPLYSIWEHRKLRTLGTG